MEYQLPNIARYWSTKAAVAEYVVGLLEELTDDLRLIIAIEQSNSVGYYVRTAIKDYKNFETNPIA